MLARGWLCPSPLLSPLTPGPFALLRYKCKEEHTRELVFSLVKVSSLFRSQQPNSAGSCQDAPHPALLVYTGHAHCVTLSLLAPLPGTPFPDPSSAALKLKHHLQDEMLVSSPFPLSHTLAHVAPTVSRTVSPFYRWENGGLGPCTPLPTTSHHWHSDPGAHLPHAT